MAYTPSAKLRVFAVGGELDEAVSTRYDSSLHMGFTHRVLVPVCLLVPGCRSGPVAAAPPAAPPPTLVSGFVAFRDRDNGVDNGVWSGLSGLPFFF